MMESDLPYRIAFASLRGINRIMAGELLARVGDERRFFEMSERQLSVAMGFKSKLFEDGYRKRLIERSEREADFVVSSNIRTLYYKDEGYPTRLSDADDAPLMLFSLGDCDYNRGHFVAVVGTRHATPYGIAFVNHLVDDLSRQLAEPLTIVSGLAFGIDVAAHSSALKAGMPTVGVLAHGLNTIYPAPHRQIAADMVRNGGGLLTEYGRSEAIHKGNFVARNRIVAGMVDCVVVAESAEKGGALITANLASGYNRDVFALPGRTSDRYSAGCNSLIASNVAALVTEASDIIRAMNWPFKSEEAVQQTLFADLSPEEHAIVDYLTQNGEAQLNRLSIALNCNVGKLMSLLIDMEFKGVVLAYPGGKYRLA